ncbi:MAG: hypothetical protein V4549_07605 [Bacteroidota bacterium]
MNNADKPAFVVENRTEIYPGLTKREYFAGLAMQAILSGIYSSPELLTTFAEMQKNENIGFNTDISGRAIKIADNILSQLGNND